MDIIASLAKEAGARSLFAAKSLIGFADPRKAKLLARQLSKDMASPTATMEGLFSGASPKYLGASGIPAALESRSAGLHDKINAFDLRPQPSALRFVPGTVIPDKYLKPRQFDDSMRQKTVQELGDRLDSIATSGRHRLNVMPTPKINSTELPDIDRPAVAYKGYLPGLGGSVFPSPSPTRRGAISAAGQGFWSSAHPEVAANYAAPSSRTGYVLGAGLDKLRMFGKNSPGFHRHIANDTRGYTPAELMPPTNRQSDSNWWQKLLRRRPTSKPIKPDGTWESKPTFETVTTWPTAGDQPLAASQYADSVFKILPSRRGMQQVFSARPPA